MALDVTVLGSAGTHTGPGRACSGYLVTTDTTAVLLDCGNGASAHLLDRMPWEDLDAIVVTHRHVDHCVDLVGGFYAMRFHATGPKSVPLYAPPEVLEVLLSLLSRDSAMAFTDVYRHHEVVAGDVITVGDLTITCHHANHPAPTVSLEVTDGERTLVYSSDSCGGEELVAAAQGADLFLCEATWQGDAGDYPPGIHLTARDAGEIASKAGVPRLMLTHVLGSLDRQVSLAEAAETYDGVLEIAMDGETYRV